MRSMRRRLKHTLERLVRCRIVDSVDSIGLAVRMLSRLAQPAAPVAGVRIRMVERRPEPQGPVADRQLRRAHAATLQVRQRLEPAVGRLAHAVGDRQKPLGAVLVNADQHQGAQLDILGPKPASDPGPDMRPAAIGQVGSPPLLHFPVPLLRRARHARGRESSRLGPRQNLQGLGHLAAGTPLSCSRGTNAPTLAALRTQWHSDKRRRFLADASF